MKQSIQFDDGIWTIEGDQLQLDIPKLLKRLGIPNTPENHDLAVQVAIKVARQCTSIDTTIIFKLHPQTSPEYSSPKIERLP